MKSPPIPKLRKPARQHDREAGVTILLVAAAIVAIMAMAALSIDVVTLYLANAEAQRAADAAALAGARVLSVSGITGDPANVGNTWQLACATAAQIAKAVGQSAQQNSVGGAAGTVTVSFPNNSDTATCSGGGPTAAFGVNPLVTVQVQRTDLPTFFARIWGRRGAGVSATATAEAFNSSNSDLVGNSGATGTVTPVQPRCVKPWIVPNFDPGNGPGTLPLVSVANGAINVPGIRIGGAAPGIVGEQFSLFADCAVGASCIPPDSTPQANQTLGSFNGLPPPPTPNLEYVPGQVPSSSTAVPSCAETSSYQKAVAGCDQSTVYQCGVVNGNTADLSINPGGSTGDTATAVQCMIHEGAAGATASGQDTLDNSVYPFRISAGSSNPLGVTGQITSSTSIVSLPIYDSSAGGFGGGGGTTPVTIVGFLQVFINWVNPDGSVNVTVLNVAGCGNGAGKNVGNAVSGTSPVPVRLVTPP